MESVRARSTASEASRYTSRTSIPFTCFPGMPYAAAMAAKSVTDDTLRKSVPMPYWLFSQM